MVISIWLRSSNKHARADSLRLGIFFSRAHLDRLGNNHTRARYVHFSTGISQSCTSHIIPLRTRRERCYSRTDVPRSTPRGLPSSSLRESHDTSEKLSSQFRRFQKLFRWSCSCSRLRKKAGKRAALATV